MSILIRQATVIDPSSPFHLQTVDLFIEKGIIRAVGPQLSQSSEREITAEGLFLSPGWVDVFAHFWDPGFEYKETLETGTRAAAAGGYTDVLILPNTTPTLQNKAAVEYIVQRSKTLPVTIHPIAAITKNGEGKELTEMYDMNTSGAKAFSDGTCCVQSSGLLLKALQYLKAINKIIIQLPDDRAIQPNGLMHEGIFSTQLGLPGKPALSEELIIARDIDLVRYTESSIHFTGISTAKSVRLIQQAKEEGLPVTCSVTPYHLTFCDADLRDYDTNLKVNPPLRTAGDRQALQKAVLEGTIDCIATHHLPQDIDNKITDFEHAQYGMIGLQTSFAVVATILPQITPERIVELFANNPRAIFGLDLPVINKNKPAHLTLFSMNKEWRFTEDQILSKSRNTPYAGSTFRGKPYGIINKEQVLLNL
ncbi:MAG: dihydroorotase [Flavisolibacter sp.]|nr:dihydroorotase [Flavisolibacter sp.]